MCGFLAFLWAVLCIGGPVYIMYRVGHGTEAAIFGVLGLVFVWCAYNLTKPI